MLKRYFNKNNRVLNRFIATKEEAKANTILMTKEAIRMNNLDPLIPGLYKPIRKLHSGGIVFGRVK